MANPRLDHYLSLEGARQMPNALDYYLEAWKLSDPQALATTASSHVYTVTADDRRVVLKLLTDRGIEEREGAIALKYFDGQGAVQLLREDEDAYLLEYAEGDNLVGLVRSGADDEATVIIGDVLNQLHQLNNQPLPDTLPSLKRWFRSLFEKAALDNSQGLNSVYTRAAPLADYLISQNRDVRVLHGDIHHENIRKHPQRGWLAFDPKGLVGERTYDAANTLCNPMDMPNIVENEARILRTSGILADKMQIEQPRVLAFVFIYTCLSASWFVSDGNEAAAQHDLTIAELVEPHIRHSSF